MLCDGRPATRWSGKLAPRYRLLLCPTSMCLCMIPSRHQLHVHLRNYLRYQLGVFVKHKCPQEWQIPLTAMVTWKFLKSKWNAKVTTSDHLFHYNNNITKNYYEPRIGLVIRNTHMIYLSPSTNLHCIKR
jgi:hypothetical protein